MLELNMLEEDLTSEELLLAKADMELMEFTKAYTAIMDTVETLQVPWVKPEDHELLLVKVAPYVDPELILEMDTENLVPKSSTIKKLLDHLAKLFRKLIDKFKKFMKKYFSMLKVRSIQVNNLLAEINSERHLYVNEDPEIKISKSMWAICNDKNILDPDQINDMAKTEISSFGPEFIVPEIKAVILGLPIDIKSAKTKAMADMAFDDGLDRIASAMRRQYNPTAYSQNDRIELQYGVAALPFKISVVFFDDPSRIPKASIESVIRTFPSKGKGLSPDDALLVLLSVQNVFAIALGREEDYEFKKTAEDFINSSGEDITEEGKMEVYKRIPRLLSFMQQVINTHITYEYKFGLAGYLAVTASKDAWALK